MRQRWFNQLRQLDRACVWSAILIFLPVLALVIWGGTSISRGLHQYQDAHAGVQTLSKGLLLLQTLESLRDYRIEAMGAMRTGDDRNYRRDLQKRLGEFQQLSHYRLGVFSTELKRYPSVDVSVHHQALLREYRRIVAPLQENATVVLPLPDDVSHLLAQGYQALLAVSDETELNVVVELPVRRLVQQVLTVVPQLIQAMGDSREIGAAALLQGQIDEPTLARVSQHVQTLGVMQQRLLNHMAPLRSLYADSVQPLSDARNGLDGVNVWRHYLQGTLWQTPLTGDWQSYVDQGLLNLQQVYDAQNALLEFAEKYLQHEMDQQRLQRYLLLCGSLVFYVVALMLLLSTQRRSHQQVRSQAERVAKTTFLTRMSYEIRTPMNGVMGMAELLKETALNDKQREYVNVIHDSGWSLLNIVDDILSYAKTDVGHVALEAIPFDLYSLVSETIQTFGLRASERNIVILFDVDPFLPEKVIGDPARLRQVLSNLISNAIRFNEDGYVEVRVSYQPESSGKKELMLHFSVKDYGVGLMKEKQTALFDMFEYPVDSEQNSESTGIGLVVSKQLVTLMGGEIGVESELGEGALFWFTAKVSSDGDSAWRDGYAQVQSLGVFRILLIDADGYASQFVRHCKGLQQVVIECVESLNDAEALIQQVTQEDYYEALLLTHSVFDEACLPVILNLKQQASAAVLGVLLSNKRAPAIDRQRYGIDFVINQYHFSLTLIFNVLNKVLHSDEPLYVKEKSELSAKNFSHLGVLVAEDNYVSQMVVLGLLKKMNVTPLVVSNGEEAYRIYQKQHDKIDVILMDCDMPVMDGYLSAQLIRDFEEKHRLNKTKIYTLSAHALPEVVKRAKQSGMNSCLNKPITYHDLSIALDHADAHHV